MTRWLLLICAVPAFAEPDFRQVNWGMTQEQVRAAESAKLMEVRSTAEGVTLTYDAVELGHRSRLSYYFVNAKLVRARHLFSAEHSDPDDYIADFKRVDTPLREKYGKPQVDRAYWSDDEHQIERAAYLNQDRATPADLLPSDPFVGLTLAAGNLKLSVEWDDRRTRIVHSLAAAGDVILHQIEYRAPRVPR